MTSQLVCLATSSKLTEVDWSKDFEICELVTRDKGLAKDIIKALKRRLTSKNSNTQLYAVMLLEMLMNNCGDTIHEHVISASVLPILVKIVKHKSNLPVREKIFLLLDAVQTSLGGASGKFPQYYAAYYDLVCARVQFGQSIIPRSKNSVPHIDSVKISIGHKKDYSTAGKSTYQNPSEASIIDKANALVEILQEVLDSIDSKNPGGAKSEFMLDLVEQSSFLKQKIMHLVMTSQDEKVVSQAIELNDQLEELLARHNALTFARHSSSSSSFEDEDEEEELDQLFRRLRKGKACISDLYEGGPVSSGCLESERFDNSASTSLGSCSEMQAVKEPPYLVPPPPARHADRERFFKEKHALRGHIRDLSLDSCTGSTSRCSGNDF